MAQFTFRHQVENGISVTLCFSVVVLAASAIGGLEFALFVGIGAACVSFVDQPGPLTRKFRSFIAALLAGSLISLLAGLASGQPVAMAGVVTLTSLGFAFATAFGRPALMLAITAVLALVIGMGIPAGSPVTAIKHTALFLAGGAGYTVLAMLASWALDDRNRRMFLNEALLAFAAYLRARADLYDPGSAQQSAIANVIEQHGVFIDRLQAARDAIFSGKLTAKRLKWVAGMFSLLDLHEAALSTDADWEALREVSDHDALHLIANINRTVADEIEVLALLLMSTSRGQSTERHRQILAALDEALAKLAGTGREDSVLGLRSTRVKFAPSIRRAQQLADVLLAPVEGAPTIPPVALAAFVKAPVAWFATLRVHLTLSSPVMRYAIRLTLAMLAGYVVTIAFPAYVHGGWILLTVALIMRASFAITRQRRNDRLLGTLAGCVAAAVLIPNLPPEGVIAGIIVGLGVAHTYAEINYKLTSFAASLMALMLLHFLEPQTFYVVDRIIDTFVGAALSILFARVLPSWEWKDVPGLVSEQVDADRDFAAQALTLNPDEQTYRLAREHALDKFTALATTVRRLSSEPPHNSQDLARLNELLIANYLFASDLASVHSMLSAAASAADAEAAARLLTETRGRVIETLIAASAPPPPGTLRRRGWFDLADAPPLTALRRRLLHVEHGAQRVSTQAVRITNV